MENLNLSIGIIETTGYIATISALDTLLNASNVIVIDKELIGAGIVVIIIAGGISNIKEAIKSAEMAVEKLNANANDVVTFEEVLMLDSKVGSPYLSNVTVEGTVLKNGKAKKIRIFKYKNKSRSNRKTQGHRQPYTKVKITKING